MKAIYVSGPYTADSNYKRQLHIVKAWLVAAEVWKVPGAYAVCPHMNTAHMDGASGLTPGQDYEKFIQADLNLLEKCDAVLLLDGWERSNGARAERNHAALKGMPIFDTLEQVRAWVTGGE